MAGRSRLRRRSFRSIRDRLDVRGERCDRARRARALVEQRERGCMTAPRVTIVTPSLNQGSFIERTIRSVLDQGYDDLEYIVIDGGSTDGTLDVIRRYEDRIAFWVSEPDNGQVHAIMKGVARSTGTL